MNGLNAATLNSRTIIVCSGVQVFRSAVSIKLLHMKRNLVTTKNSTRVLQTGKTSRQSDKQATQKRRQVRGSTGQYMHVFADVLHVLNLFLFGACREKIQIATKNSRP